MQINRVQTDTLTEKIIIEIQAEDYMPEVEKALKKHAAKADIKGFRKGQVPVGVIKKMYGNALLGEELNRILEQKLFAYIDDEKLEILGQPLPLNEAPVQPDIQNPSAYTFEYEVGIQPKFELTHIANKPSYTQDSIIIDDVMLDEEVDALRKRFGKNENPDTLEENDIVYVDVKEVNDDGSEKENAYFNTTSFNVNMLIGDDKAAFMKLKKGDSLVLNIFSAFDKSREDVKKYILNAKEEQYEALGDFYKVTVSNTNRLVPAQLDEAFFAEAYPGDEIKTEDAMRDKIKADLKAYFDKSTTQGVLQDLAKDLIEKTDMQFPESFLKRWIKVGNSKTISDEQIETEFPAFIKQLKWDLICGKVAKENNFQVSAEDIKAYTRQMVQSQLLQYGLGYMPDEQLDNFGKRYMEDKKHIQRTHELLLEEKILNHLKQFIVIEEKPISLNDYNKMMEAKNASATVEEVVTS